MRSADVHRFFVETARDFPGVAYLGRISGAAHYLISDLEAIERITIYNQSNYAKGERAQFMAPLLGQSLPLLDGERWKIHRRTMTPIFRRRMMNELFSIIQQTIDTHLDALVEEARSATSIDLGARLSRITMDVGARTLLGADMDPQVCQAVGDAVAYVLRFLYDRTFEVLSTPLWVPTARNRRYHEALAQITSMVDRILEARRDAPMDGAPTDLLQAMLAMRDAETGQPLPPDELRDEVQGVLASAFESTASTLAFGFHYLCRHGDVTSKLVAEIDEHVGLGASAPPIELEALDAMPYLQRVFEESLRIHPPVWVMARTNLEEDTLAGQPVPKGSFVLFSPYVVHHRPDLWPSPDRFDPDRFLPEAVEARPRMAYLPFGHGGRFCIGKHLARLEGLYLLARVVQRFEFHPVETPPVTIQAHLVLQARDGVHMHMRPRA